MRLGFYIMDHRRVRVAMSHHGGDRFRVDAGGRGHRCEGRAEGFRGQSVQLYFLRRLFPQPPVMV